MHFDADNYARALDLLKSAVGPVRAKQSCVACRVTNDPTEPDTLVYCEEWESDQAFRRHVKTEDFWRVLVAMDLCSEEPEVTVGCLSATQGLEYLRQLRQAGSDPPACPESPDPPPRTNR